MDKKKIIELIKKGMLYQSKSSHVSSYKEKAKNCFEEALSELHKSDWISVEDELPPYDEVVWVTSKEDPEEIYFSHRTNRKEVIVDKHQFATYKEAKPITHWRKIDKLEV